MFSMSEKKFTETVLKQGQGSAIKMVEDPRIQNNAYKEVNDIQI